MAAFLWAGQSQERATPILQSLALACATTLILQPEASNDPGFQLSYLAVLSIILVGVPASQKLTTPTLAEKFTPRDEQRFSQRSLIYGKNFLLSGLCISLAATLAGTPLTLAYFNSASWGGIFANVILVPLSEIPLILGMISLTLSFSENLSTLAQGMNGVATLVLQGMTTIAEGLAQIPHLTLQGTVSTWFSGPLCAMCLLVCFFKQAEEKCPYRLLGFPALILILWLIFFVHPID
jgi:competence protein ComEC